MIYKIHYDKMSDDYIELNPEIFQDIQLACMMSEFQKISTEPIEVATSDDLGGLTFPDYMRDGSVPLFSEKLFKVMKDSGVNNLFTREITIRDDFQEISQKYILGVPPRIRVLDTFGNIDESKVGNYLIFKVAESLDDSIYITSRLEKIFKEFNPLGMEVLKADVL